jgi:nickel/cobalt exporter
MFEALTVLLTNFWIGAVHAATPGHGKTIAAAYIVGARGKPIDAVILGVFVTLSHTSGIVIVGLLASMGIPGLIPQKIEAWLALATGVLVVLIGLWTLWQQRDLIIQLNMPKHLKLAHDRDHAHDDSHAHDHAHSLGRDDSHDQPGALGATPGHAPDHSHEHGNEHGHDHDHGHGHHDHDHGHHHHDGEQGFHSHGWGMKHTHDLSLVTSNRPSLLLLMGLGIAGGLLPDPAALGLLLTQLAQGKVMLGLAGVLIFSVGFAGTLVLVGIVAAKVGEKILDWLAGPWAMRMQVGTSLLIVIVGVVLTFNAAVMVTTLK